MGFLDHLFKPKPNEEKMGEGEQERDAAAATGGDGEIPVSGPDPGAFLQPKNFAPRSGGTIYPPTRPVVPAGRKPSVEERRQEIVITLGDVLSRIPTQLLRAGFHDEKRELRFPIDDLSADISRGRAAVPLSRIAVLCPDVFSREIAPEDDSEIRLPLQKLVEQIGRLRGRSAMPSAEATGLLAVPTSAPAKDSSSSDGAPALREENVHLSFNSARPFVSVPPPALPPSSEPVDGVNVPRPIEETLPPRSPESNAYQREPGTVATSASATAGQVLPPKISPPAMLPFEESHHAPADPASSASASTSAGFRIHPPPLVRPIIVQPPRILAVPSLAQAETDPPVPPAPAIEVPRNYAVLQALFMTDESLDLAAVCRHAAALPGVGACALEWRGERAFGGELPEGFDLATLHLAAARMNDAARAIGSLPLGAFQSFTLHGDQAAISLFTRPGLLLAVLHRALPPGVRERLATVADEVARP